MTRLSILAATTALAALSLAACSKPAGETTTAAETAAAPAATPVAATTTVQPGYWESIKVSPGEEPETDHDCVTAEDSDINAQLKKSLASGDCKFTKQQVGGGRIDIEGTCGAQAGVVGVSTTRITGAYAPTSYNFDLSIRMTVKGEPMNMDMKVTGKRIGDTCPSE